jgi:hypothetical protein
MNDEIGLLHRDGLVSAMNRQTAAIIANADSFVQGVDKLDKIADKAGTISAATIQQSELAANRVVDRVGMWTGGIVLGSILLWFGFRWLTTHKVTVTSTEQK